MKMKYFRFLYEETNSCMIHFGEVKDEHSKETLTFLYLQAYDGRNMPEYVKTTPLTYPEKIELVALGTLNKSVKAVWEEMQKTVKVRTLILPEGGAEEEWNLEHVDEVIRLGKSDLWEKTVAGWRMRVMGWTEGALAFWHDSENGSEGGIDTEAAEIVKFEDCVMSMKAIDANRRCCGNPNPDEYGCALGCALHQDYDVCKFRYGNGSNPYVTGTLLAAGYGSKTEWDTLWNWIQLDEERIRFYVLQDLESENWKVLSEAMKQEPGRRKYFVGMTGGMSDRALANICRNGFSSVPVLLQEGCGVCCSGFLKYWENEK